MRKLFLISTLGLMQSGCFLGGAVCETADSYAHVQAAERISVPEDLDNLDRAREASVPASTSPADKAPGECIDKPPKF